MRLKDKVAIVTGGAHGGAAGSGTSAGKANGAYRHGRQTQKAHADRRETTAWLSILRAAADNID